MQLESVREIKSHFLQAVETFAVGVNTPQRKFPKSIGLGITKKNGQFVPAVRCYGNGSGRVKNLQQVFVDLILGKSKGEADVEWVEMPQAYALNIDAYDSEKFTQERCRPLKIGYSCGHYQITAGTIGIFARPTNEKSGVWICGNAHVLNATNKGKPGHPVLQPGVHDSGKLKTDKVAELTRSIPIKGNHNKVDCAIAKVDAGIECDLSTIEGLGKYAGDGDSDTLRPNDPVAKLGRTTQLTKGVVTAIEVDNLRVNYGEGVYSFDQQTEIQCPDGREFSAGGDSSSCIINSDMKGVGLLFAGGSGRTYANTMNNVRKALKIKTLC